MELSRDLLQSRIRVDAGEDEVEESQEYRERFLLSDWEGRNVCGMFCDDVLLFVAMLVYQRLCGAGELNGSLRSSVEEKLFLSWPLSGSTIFTSVIQVLRGSVLPWFDGS